MGVYYIAFGVVVVADHQHATILESGLALCLRVAVGGLVGRSSKIPQFEISLFFLPVVMMHADENAVISGCGDDG